MVGFLNRDIMFITHNLLPKKMAPVYIGKTVKQFLIDLARARLAEMERKGILPKGKGRS